LFEDEGYPTVHLKQREQFLQEPCLHLTFHKGEGTDDLANTLCMRDTGNLNYMRHDEPSMRTSFIFASDLHGDTARMRLLVKKAIELECPRIILGGDLFRMGGGDPINSQREFLKNEVQPIFEEFPGEIHTIFGNNDLGTVTREVSRSAPKLKVLQGTSFTLDEGIEVLGISHVPVTPFPIKDWERREATSPVSPMSRLDGVCSWSGSLEDCIVSDDRTMMDELTDLGPLSGRLLISHGPPYGTCADLGHGGFHLGSTDLRGIIESEGPAAVLSGHIHESPKRSGRMMELLGDTWIGNPGSQHGESTFILGEFRDRLKLTGFRGDTSED
jgi:Icc-related predicted phosphoesterase